VEKRTGCCCGRHEATVSRSVRFAPVELQRGFSRSPDVWPTRHQGGGASASPWQGPATGRGGRAEPSRSRARAKSPRNRHKQGLCQLPCERRGFSEAAGEPNPGPGGRCCDRDRRPAFFPGLLLFFFRTVLCVRSSAGKMVIPGNITSHVHIFEKIAWQNDKAFVLPRSRRGRAVIPGSSAVEHSTVNRQVAGSNPARGASFKRLR
jgi:hypothetical protein